MGGTSTDVSVIKNGELTLTREGSVEHLPLRFPMIDIATVGAGGGSIARVDRGGVLQVGPESAGADPGPACYGKSELATVTDAFVVTGAILPEMFLGGKMKIFPKKSVKFINNIAGKIGKTLFETAEGIIRISVSSMERALRSVTLEKGEDPRLYTLMPFGGAGALVATLLAERLGIKKILIPPNQGVFSALGMLEANFKKEFTQSFLKMYSPGIENRLDEIFSTITKEAEQILAEEGFLNEECQILHYLDLRYKGQSYELTVPYTGDFLKEFHKNHHLLYSYTLEDKDCEIVNLRVVAVGKTPARGPGTLAIRIEKKEPTPSDPRIFCRKEVYFNGDFQQFCVYYRKDLVPGSRLKTPSIVVSDDSTVIIDHRFEAAVDNYSNILLNKIDSQNLRGKPNGCD